LLLLAFTALIKSAIEVVTGIPNKICTWSFHPPTAKDFAPFLVIIPEMYLPAGRQVGVNYHTSL